MAETLVMLPEAYPFRRVYLFDRVAKELSIGDTTVLWAWNNREGGVDE